MFLIGSGYNPAFLTGRLTMPESIHLLELGLGECKRLETQGSGFSTPLSLHFSRSPLTEGVRSQDAFLRHLGESVDPHGFVSIGVHITGARHTGIGRFGYSTQYAPDPRSVARAVRFIGKLLEIARDVWIENTNYYSRSACGVIDTWKSVSELCARTGAGLILDLAHLYVDSSNVGLDPAVALGAVPWPYVREIHLSGTQRGRDGTYHDGHGEAVAESVWELLRQSLGLVPRRAASVYFTLEHTDPRWGEAPSRFAADFSRLRRELDGASAPKGPAHASTRSASYARSYLRSDLNSRIPALRPALAQRGVSFDEKFDEWIALRLKQRKPLALTHETLSHRDLGRFLFAPEDFLAFAVRGLT